MLRKILLSSILILSVGCGDKSIKNRAYRGVINGENREFVINKNKLDYIDLKYNTTNYYFSVFWTLRIWIAIYIPLWLDFLLG